jgi:hypothetical protein
VNCNTISYIVYTVYKMVFQPLFSFYYPRREIYKQLFEVNIRLFSNIFYIFVRGVCVIIMHFLNLILLFMINSQIKYFYKCNKIQGQRNINMSKRGTPATCKVCHKAPQLGTLEKTYGCVRCRRHSLHTSCFYDHATVQLFLSNNNYYYG